MDTRLSYLPAADILLMLAPLRRLATAPCLYLSALGAHERKAAALLALKVHGNG